MSTTTTTRNPNCYHVTATNGLVYGVAAYTQQEARQFLRDRLTNWDGDPSTRVASTVKVGSWPGVDWGTVLCYGEAR